MAKYKTKGMIAKIGATNPPSGTIIQLGDSTLELGERDALINATTHDTTGSTHEFLDPGFKTPLSFSGELMYDPADTVHEVVRAAHASGDSLYFEVTLPDAGAAKFLALVRVRNASIPLPVMGKLMLSVQLEGLAATTFTP